MQTEVILGAAAVTSGALCLWWSAPADRRLKATVAKNLRLKSKDRQKRILLSLPDTLDQITVCVEAGLGLEGAMARAAKTGSGPLADEIVRMLQDVQLGVPRKEAMRGLADRNAVDELRQ